MNDTVFLIYFSLEEVSVQFTTSRETTISAKLPNNLQFQANTWYHLTILVDSEGVTLYGDGQNTSFRALSQLEVGQLQIPDQIYLYTGTTKHNDSLPFSGSLWNPSISFSYPSRSIYSSLMCALSCGEVISSDVSDAEISIAPYELSIQVSNFDLFRQSLEELTYDNVALEPTTHDREVLIEVSDGITAANATISIKIQLKNDHRAELALDTNSVYYYVPPSSDPHPEPLSEQAVFTDGDTTQSDFRIQVALTPPLHRSCDRIDYIVYVKLQQCKAPVTAVINLLPNSQWGLATQQSVQPFFSSLLGYFFYGSGVFIPDMSIYSSVSVNPAHFTFACWIQFDTEGTVAHIRNQTQGFLFHLRVNSSTIELVYTIARTVSQTLHWNWSPGDDWMHVAVVVENQRVQLCINGFYCNTQLLSFRDSSRVVHSLVYRHTLVHYQLRRVMKMDSGVC